VARIVVCSAFGNDACSWLKNADAAPIFSRYRPFKRFVGGFAAVEPMDILSLKGAAGGVMMRIEQSKTYLRVQILVFEGIEHSTCHVFRSFGPRSAP
jgi:hypothetical protein